MFPCAKGTFRQLKASEPHIRIAFTACWMLVATDIAVRQQTHFLEAFPGSLETDMQVLLIFVDNKVGGCCESLVCTLHTNCFWSWIWRWRNIIVCRQPVGRFVS